MSTNCIDCIKNERTGSDLLCDECRAKFKTEFLLKVIKAQDELLACYRLGGQPSEHTLEVMAIFRGLCIDGKFMMLKKGENGTTRT